MTPVTPYAMGRAVIAGVARGRLISGAFELRGSLLIRVGG